MALFVPTVSFSYLHLSYNVVGAFPAGVFVAALGLGWVFVLTRSFAVPVLLHLGFVGIVVALAPVRSTCDMTALTAQPSLRDGHDCSDGCRDVHNRCVVNLDDDRTTLICRGLSNVE